MQVVWQWSHSNGGGYLLWVYISHFVCRCRPKEADSTPATRVGIARRYCVCDLGELCWAGQLLRETPHCGGFLAPLAWRVSQMILLSTNRLQSQQPQPENAAPTQRHLLHRTPPLLTPPTTHTHTHTHTAPPPLPRVRFHIAASGSLPPMLSCVNLLPSYSSRTPALHPVAALQRRDRRRVLRPAAA